MKAQRCSSSCWQRNSWSPLQSVRHELLKAQTEEQRLQIESRNRIFEIAEKYGELAAKALSDEELAQRCCRPKVSRLQTSGQS